MADYYVMYNGIQYDVESFDAGVAKAKELGSDAVLYVNAEQTENHAFCDGVKAVFSGGCATNKYVFGGNKVSAIESSDVTIADGYYGAVYTGGLTNGGVAHGRVTVTGGTVGDLYAGGRPATGGTGEVLVTGGSVGYIFGTGRDGVLTDSTITIQGGQVNYVKAAANNGTINNLTINLQNGYVYNAIYAGGIGTVGDVTINLTGGTLRQSIYGSGDNAAKETRTGGTVINIDGIDHTGKYAYGMNKVAPLAFTANMKSGSVYIICGGAGGTAVTDEITAEYSPVINMTGGTTGWLIGASYAYATILGDTTVNVSDGLVVNNILGGGYRKDVIDVIGDTHINVSGGTINAQVSGGSYGGGEIQGNTNVSVTGGTFVGTSCWIVGGARSGVVTGKATVKVENAEVYHIFGGGNLDTAVVQGGTDVQLKNALVHGVIQGGGYKGNVEGGVTLSVTGGTTYRDMKDTYGAAGWVIGGSTHIGTVKGAIATTVTGAAIGGSIVGGSYYSNAESNVTLTVSDTTVGTRNADNTVDCGDIYAVAGEGVDVIGTGHTAAISGVSALGGLYQALGGNYIEGDTALTVSNSSFGDGIYVEYGKFAVDPDTGEAYNLVETFINGNVRFDLTNVTVTGNVWGKGRNFDLVEFEEGKGAALAVTGTLTAGGEVAYFDSIAIATGATIAAGSVTAGAITATASETQGLYTLATGFAAQTCVVNVVNANGGTLGVVSLSENVTSGTFTAGGLDYTVSVVDNALKLQVGDEPGPVPPTPTSIVAEVILTITDTAHEFKGATGGWKVQNDQTVAWQDLTTLGSGYAYLGLGVTAADKAMPDMYVYNAEAKYVAAYVTDDTGAIASFDSIFLGEAAMIQVGLADFNADGVSDLLLRTADGFVGYYAAGTFHEVQGLGLEWNVAALGDVDGNGRADVVIAHEAGYVGAYLIGNDGSISWADLGNLDSSTAIVGAGDVNGDGTDDVIVQVGANYYGAWLCGNGSVTGFFGIGEFNATVQDIADYNADGKDDLLFRTAGGVVGAALITGADATAWAEYGALGDEWSTKGVGIL